MDHCSEQKICMLILTAVAIAFVAGMDFSADDKYGTGEMEGHCIWYGVCNKTAKLPCSYNGSAIFSDDPKLYRIIQNWCPELLVNATFVQTCCDLDQAKTFVQDLAIPYGILSRCPSCWSNMRRMLCEMTCGPRQSLFLHVKSLTPID